MNTVAGMKVTQKKAELRSVRTSPKLLPRAVSLAFSLLQANQLPSCL